MACSKIFSGDLPELINEIIQYFHNDFSTLHSCILVNRLWCRLAIPLLWEDPFSIPTENYHFIEIYLHNLNEDDKSKLYEYGINIDLFPSNTLFNYPSFIKCLDTFEIFCSIENWVAISYPYSYNPTCFTNSVRLIYKSLFKIFIESQANLHTLEILTIETYNKIDNDCINSAIELILQNPNFIINIKDLRLTNDKILTKIDSLLALLSSNCNSISTLYFQFQFKRNEKVSIEKYSSQIINSQRNLKKVLFYSNEFPLYYYPLLSLKNSNCSNTLKTVIFYCINFKNLNLDEVFEQISALESIHIVYCHSLTIQQIVSITKPFKLISLFMKGFQNKSFRIESFQLLLQKSGDYLENIEFDSTISNELKQQLYELIIKYCTRIKFLDLRGFDNQNIYLAFNIIRNIGQNLNYLSINFSRFCFRSPLNDIEDNELSLIVLQELGQILPFNLEYLSLSLKINARDLEVFLKNSQNTFIKKLLIRNKMHHAGNEDILPCIKEHIMKKKRVKYLAIEEIFIDKRRDLFSFKDQVKEFELYNIKVQHYNDLEIQVCNFICEML